MELHGTRPLIVIELKQMPQRETCSAEQVSLCLCMENTEPMRRSCTAPLSLAKHSLLIQILSAFCFQLPPSNRDHFLPPCPLCFRHIQRQRHKKLLWCPSDNSKRCAWAVWEELLGSSLQPWRHIASFQQHQVFLRAGNRVFQQDLTHRGKDREPLAA